MLRDNKVFRNPTTQSISRKNSTIEIWIWRQEWIQWVENMKLIPCMKCIKLSHKPFLRLPLPLYHHQSTHEYTLTKLWSWKMYVFAKGSLNTYNICTIYNVDLLYCYLISSPSHSCLVTTPFNFLLILTFARLLCGSENTNNPLPKSAWCYCECWKCYKKK